MSLHGDLAGAAARRPGSDDCVLRRHEQQFPWHWLRLFTTPRLADSGKKPQAPVLGGRAIPLAPAPRGWLVAPPSPGQGGVPSLGMPRLAADESLDAAALAFLTARELEARKKEQKAKQRSEEEEMMSLLAVLGARRSVEQQARLSPLMNSSFPARKRKRQKKTSPILAVPVPYLGVACSRLSRQWIPVNTSAGGFLR